MLLDIEGFPDYKLDLEEQCVYKRIKSVPDKNNHLIVGLRNGKLKTVPIHRLVFEAVNGPIPEGFDVHHKDGNPQNNEPSNLVLLSHEEHLSLHHVGLKHTEAARRKMSMNSSVAKPVEMLDKELNLLKTYPSGSSTASDGFCPQCVNMCCKGKIKTHKGYVFRYA